MAKIQKPSEDGKLGLLSLEEAGLQELSNRFSSGELNLFEYYEWLERHIEKREPTVRALLPEKDRKGRLEREIKALYDQYPEADMRPPLFGIPFGIKDIFHADDFETQAGSKLPPEELAGQEAE